jgi:hypothetical protein
MPGRPDENSLPGLPEEWGDIRIPDDAAELEPLAVKVRRELRRRERRERRLPYTVLAITVIITLVSMFAVPWLGGASQPRPENVVTTTEPPTGSSTADCDGAECDTPSPGVETSPVTETGESGT